MAEEVEGVRVFLNGGKTGNSNGKKDRDREKGEGGGKRERESVRLSDVASVVARGRNVAVMVGEKDVS